MPKFTLPFALGLQRAALCALFSLPLSAVACAATPGAKSTALAPAVQPAANQALTPASAKTAPTTAQSTTARPTNKTTSVPGGVYQFPVPAGVSSVTYAGKRALIYAGQALVGIPIKSKPGEHSLNVVFDDKSELTHKFAVHPKAYPEQRLTIKNRKMVNPDESSMARIRQEGATMRAAYAAYSEPVGDPVPFVQPLEGIITSPFGRRRVLNGEPRNPHSGLDIAGATGTPIAAPAPGAVVVTGDFYFNGNTVLVDHGHGLVSMYCHLSEISVEQGDQLDRGSLVGLVGATGRVTGPHLHWSVSLNGQRVDPVLVMQTLSSTQNFD